MAEPTPIYLDTCVIIELLQQSDQARFDACEALRLRAYNDELVIVVSALTITEVNRLPNSGKLPEEQSQLILDFFENPYISVRPVDRRIAESAHHLTRTHGLTNLDAIHVATADLCRVDVLYTFDSAKNKRKGLLRHNLAIGKPPLRIEIPPDPTRGTLLHGIPETKS